MPKNALATAAPPGVSGWVRRVFFVVFAGVFAALFVGVIFFNVHFPHYRPLAVLALALLWLLLLYGLFWLTGRAGAFLARREKLALAAFFVFLVATQLFFYSQLAAYPTRDFERVFTGAVNFTVNGFIEEPYLDYFYKYPNNMPATILLQFIFRVFHRLGYSNFYVVGALLAAVCIQLCYAGVYLCCRRLFGVGWGFFALGLLWLCLPLQCYISIFYTDVLALPFAPAAFYLYLRLLDAKSWKGRLLAAALMGAALALGTKLKHSVAIVLVAVAVDLLLRLDWRRLAAAGGCFLVLFLAANAGFNSYMYAHFLDESVAADRATPFSAWVMMGLARDGAHDADDNYIIWNEPTAEAKRQRAAEVIGQRLGEYTPGGLVAFLYQKSLRSFGSGNLDYPHIVADSPMRQSFLVECISENGRYFHAFDTLTQGYHVALFLLMVCGALVFARRGGTAAFVPYLTVFGLWGFLLVWESGQRYLLQYMGMFIIAAAAAAQALTRYLPRPLIPASRGAVQKDAGDA
ncbi:MAG: glycosyltransferase family 39 protein [Oscillospiraceae bacterium]